MTDWIMIIITAIYVLATIIICYFNAKSVNAIKQQTNEMILQRELLNRPYISISYEIIRSGLMCFIIENIGTQPAFNINIHLNDEFINKVENQNSREHLALLQKSNMYLASKQKSTMYIDSQINFKKIASEIAKFHVSYNEKYTEIIEIDISQYAWMLVYTSPIEDISQHLKKIKEDQVAFEKNLLKHLNIPNPLNVVLQPAYENDKLKFRVFKSVCMNTRPTLKTISEQCELSLEMTHSLLVELMCVDNLVKTYIGEDWTNINENAVWFNN